MRLNVQNKTGYDDAEITAICKWVASFFPQRKGRVLAKIVKLKKFTAFARDIGIHLRERDYPHTGFWNGTRALCSINFNMGVYPHTVTERKYFKHAKGNPNPYTLFDWRESLIHVLAHELTHSTKANRRMRRSVQELHSENKATEIVLKWRDFGRRNVYTDLSVREKLVSIGITTNEEDAKVSALRGRLQKWETKAKRAKTAITKLNRQLKYYERKTAAKGK